MAGRKYLGRNVILENKLEGENNSGIGVDPVDKISRAGYNLNQQAASIPELPLPKKEEAQIISVPPL